MVPSTFIFPKPQRLLIIRLLCWLAIPLGASLGVWGIPAAFTWLLSWAGASVNYTLVFCLFPELILACPGLMQGIILSRLLPESRLPLRLWLFLTILAAIVAWVGLWFFALLFGGANDPVTTEPSLFNQTMSAVMLGAWIGIITGMIQGMILDSYIPDITPVWILLSLSSWATTAVFFLVLLPALLRPVPLTSLNDTPVTPACRSVPEDPYLLTFSPDGQFLAVAGGDKAIQVWRMAELSLLTTLTGHTDSVMAIAFSPNGQILASAGGDKTIRLWDLKDQAELFRLTDEQGRYAALAFSPDGSKMASLREDGALTVWQINH